MPKKLKFASGDMWSVYSEDNLFIITTNSFLKKSGALVMGRGIARGAMKRIPGIAFFAGKAVSLSCGHLGKYGFIHIAEKEIGLLQTKLHYKDNTNISLLEYSLRQLKKYIKVSGNTKPIHLNFPGVGLGGLHIADVFPFLIKRLSDYDVTIWTKDNLWMRREFYKRFLNT